MDMTDQLKEMLDEKISSDANFKIHNYHLVNWISFALGVLIEHLAEKDQYIKPKLQAALLLWKFETQQRFEKELEKCVLLNGLLDQRAGIKSDDENKAKKHHEKIKKDFEEGLTAFASKVQDSLQELSGETIEKNNG